MTGSQLSPMTLIQLRGIARDCWAKANGNPERAEIEFSERYPGVEQREVFYRLTQHWIDNEIETPSVVIDETEAKILGLETD